MTQETFDFAIVGAGIVGLAHALAAARRGLRVVVFDRDARANSASIRNFGLITVTGQCQGDTWRRALRSREVWDEIAVAAGVPVIHRGMVVPVHSELALQVLREFIAGPMGARCELLDPDMMTRRAPVLKRDGVAGCLYSPHELRVEPRQAIPRLAAWLEQAHGIAFVRNAQVRGIEPPFIHTSAGRYRARQFVVCPGADLLSLFPENIARHRLQLCKLHMLRLAPQPAGWRLPGAVMMDLSLVRYLGYARCPSAGALRVELEKSEAATLAHGIHLIAVQSADGSLVVGDSHHYDATPNPFAPSEVDELIMRHASETIAIPDPRVAERWIGVYPSAEAEPCLIERPGPEISVVIVTSGTGMSTAFGLAEEVIAEMTEPDVAAHKFIHRRL